MKNSFSSARRNYIAEAVCVGLLFIPVAGFCSADKFVDSDDYKDKGFVSCNISDYSDMLEGEDIQWEWVSPDAKFSKYNLSIRNVENKSDKKSMTKNVKSTFQDVLKDIGTNTKGEKANVDVCLYEVQEYSYGKAWIPFAGGHQMQAGAGVEVVVTDAKGKPIAKFRQFAREGVDPNQALKEAAEDIFDYIAKQSK